MIIETPRLVLCPFEDKDSANIASVKRMQRIGMRCEELFVKSLWLKDSWVDELWFAILREKWKLT